MTGKISWTTTHPDGTVSKFEAESAALNNTDMGNLKSFVESIPRTTSSTEKKEAKHSKVVGISFLILFIALNIGYMFTPEKFIQDHNLLMIFIFLCIIVVGIYSLCAHLIFENNTISISILILSLVCIALTTKVTTINNIYKTTEKSIIEKTKDK